MPIPTRSDRTARKGDDPTPLLTPGRLRIPARCRYPASRPARMPRRRGRRPRRPCREEPNGLPIPGESGAAPRVKGATTGAPLPDACIRRDVEASRCRMPRREVSVSTATHAERAELIADPARIADPTPNARNLRRIDRTLPGRDAHIAPRRTIWINRPIPGDLAIVHPPVVGRVASAPAFTGQQNPTGGRFATRPTANQINT